MKKMSNFAFFFLMRSCLFYLGLSTATCAMTELDNPKTNKFGQAQNGMGMAKDMAFDSKYTAKQEMAAKQEMGGMAEQHHYKQDAFSGGKATATEPGKSDSEHEKREPETKMQRDSPGEALKQSENSLDQTLLFPAAEESFFHFSSDSHQGERGSLNGKPFAALGKPLASSDYYVWQDDFDIYKMFMP